ncbi:MAG: MarR family winged helix-turn-helix transcriptional regulator [Gemmatimonadaceae bacterium]|nr:MarR family winged helix-turn-helix transcriptional regulator [Gemmatimonadaceae bacterium]
MPDRVRSLAEEIQQTRPWSSAAEEALVSVMRTSALVRRLITKKLEPCGISQPQYNVLRILRGAGREGLPTLAVRDRLVEEAPGITRLIDKLERGKYVKRDRSGRDRRTVRVQITAAGLELLTRADVLVREAQQAIERGLPNAEDQQALVALLAKARSAL